MKSFLLSSLFLCPSLFAGNLTLTGKTAKLEGPNGGNDLNFNGDVLRYWHSDKSQPVWTFNAKEAGKVNLSITYSNGKHGGTPYKLSFGKTTYSGKVKDTKQWGNFITLDLGEFQFEKGLNQLTLDPFDMKTRAVMDLKNITLSGDDTELLQQVIFFSEKRAGYKSKLAGLHPSLTLEDITPEGINFKVNGIDFLSDGTMVIASWDSKGSVYLLKNPQGKREDMKLTLFASGIHEPLGVCVVKDEIYVQQKQELTRLKDTNNDGRCDTFECVSNAWDVSTNFHEFTFGPLYKDGYFYTALAIAVDPGGATTQPQQKDRGCLIKIDPKTGKYEIVSAGLRTPNGIGFTADGKGILISDNQGDYLPASKIVLATGGEFFNHKYQPPHLYSTKKISQPVAWLPQNEIGNSPTEPIAIKEGIFKGHYLVGDIHNGGLRRLQNEEINGELQGTVFRFTQGIRGGVNRLSYGSNGDLYAGISGYNGNWGFGKRTGLARIKLDAKAATFEIATLTTLSNGVELEFTQPLKDGLGWDPAFYKIDTYTYQPTIHYGGPKLQRENLTVKSASVSPDRKKVFLEITGIKPKFVVHGLLASKLTNEQGVKSWNPEWWTTVNNIPSNKNGVVIPRPANAVMSRHGAIAKIPSSEKFAKAKLAFKETCASCHTYPTQAPIGPNLAGLLGRKQTVIRNGKEVEVTVDKAYIRKAILNPAAEHPKGFMPIMPNLSSALTKEQIDELVEWISQQKK